MAPEGGQALGSRYLVHELIGRGGMGRVYRGTVRDSGETVAVKVLRDDLAMQGDVVGRFVQERQVLRDVVHDNIVRVRDLVVESDELAIIMDYVPGGDLRALPVPMDQARAVQLMIQVADGLVAVHASQVVHRDLKPANVLCDRDQDGDLRLRLTDFGIARLLGGSTTHITSVIGTPAYLAPEVSTQGLVTPAADVYAFGVMFYELCVGQLPFSADHPMALVFAHANHPVNQPAGMSDPLWQIIGSLLAKDPTARPTADELARRLRLLTPHLHSATEISPSAPTPPLASELAVATAASRLTSFDVATVIPTDGSGAPGAAGAGGEAKAGLDAPTVLRPIASPPVHVLGPSDPLARQASLLAGRGRRWPVWAATLAAAMALAAVAAGIALRLGPFAGSSDTSVQLAGLGTRGSATAASASSAGAQSTGPQDPGPTFFADPPNRTATTEAQAANSAYSGAAVQPAGSAGQPATHQAGPPTSKATANTAPAAGTTTTAPAPAGATSSAPAVTHQSPAVPVVSRSPTSAGAVAQGTGGTAQLVVSNVVANEGTISKVTVHYSGGSVLAIDGGNDSWSATISGLTNGTTYTFVATVCNSLNRCTDSTPLQFMPYGKPDAGTLSLSVNGTTVTVIWGPVVQNFNPITMSTCFVEMSSTPGDASTAPVHYVGTGSGSYTFTGTSGTTYWANKHCYNGTASANGTTSNKVTVV